LHRPRQAERAADKKYSDWLRDKQKQEAEALEETTKAGLQKWESMAKRYKKVSLFVIVMWF